MGLFDKKKKGEDDYDSPVEQVSLSSRSAPAPREPAPAPREPAPTAAAPAPAAAQQQPVRTIVAEPPDVPNYGIEKAIELMRLLPPDNVELVVQVVKKTLESLNIEVPSIIKDAQRKLGDIEGRIGVLKKEIADLEAEIATRRGEIGSLEADHMETSSVKSRLELAEKLASDRKAAAAAGASAASASAPAAAQPSGPMAPSRPSSSGSGTLPPSPLSGTRPSGQFGAIKPEDKK